MPNITTHIGNLPGYACGSLDSLTEALNGAMTNPETLDAELSAALPYTPAQLAIMNENDKIYAFREANGLPHAP